MASEQTGASTSGGSFDKGSGLASGRTKSGVSTGIGHPWKARNLEALSESRPSRSPRRGVLHAAHPPTKSVFVKSSACAGCHRSPVKFRRGTHSLFLVERLTR